MKIHLERGVAELVRRLGEKAITVELTLDFEGDVLKSAVAFAGPSEPSLGYQRVTVGDLDVWWRQRLVFASREPRVTTKIRPRRLHVSTVGRALAASADYA
ncbi:MAG TPA: hypothetical protein VGL92_16145 [Acidimicrobiia bacterium]